jgi:hypothetical protein
MRCRFQSRASSLRHCRAKLLSLTAKVVCLWLSSTSPRLEIQGGCWVDLGMCCIVAQRQRRSGVSLRLEDWSVGAYFTAIVLDEIVSPKIYGLFHRTLNGIISQLQRRGTRPLSSTQHPPATSVLIKVLLAVSTRRNTVGPDTRRCRCRHTLPPSSRTALE